MNNRKAIAIIIGCSARANAAQGIVPRSRVGKPDEKSDEKEFNNLQGVIPDTAAAYRLFNQSLNFDIAGYTTGVSYEDVNKTKSIRAIKKAFYSRKHTDVILYYAGHGMRGIKKDSHGAWCFTGINGNTEIIKPKDIFQLWRDAKRWTKNHRLFIISDSCYSGQWVVEAKKYKNIYVQAACGPDETADESVDGGGGYFTRRWADGAIHCAPKSMLNALNPVAFAVSAFVTPRNLVKTLLQTSTSTPCSTSAGKGTIFTIGKSYLHFFNGWGMLAQVKSMSPYMFSEIY